MTQPIRHNLNAAQKAALRNALAVLEAAVRPGGTLAPTLDAIRALPPHKREAALAPCPNLTRLLQLGCHLTERLPS